MNTFKKIKAMQTNKRDWTMEQLISIANHYNISWENNGTSHYIFRHTSIKENLSIPKHKDIHPSHISRFLKFIEKIEKPQ